MLVENYSSDCEIRGFSRQTIQTYRSHILHYMGFINDLDQPSTDELRHIMTDLSDRDYAGKTYKSYWCAVNDFYKFLMYEGIANDNPIEGFRERYLPRILKTTESHTRQNLELYQMQRLIARSHTIEE
ncbi:site-specific recombinase XerD [Methanohalophilus levihalophilus]|uniref:site-specific integrase n=1 Tax=Methanohalophilus levihalophilus TaxID=1431282 RepID=UPI001AE42E07|nr:site-specific recombinase XerD [Methanohalophilus levihalophilus]